MKVVLDTNVLLMSIPKISKYRPIFDGLIKARYDLAISANAQFIVSNDSHFNELNNISFPPVRVIDADSFLKGLEN